MSDRLKQFILLVGDISTLWLALFLAASLRQGGSALPLIVAHISTFVALFTLWLVVFMVVNLYDLRGLRNNLDFFIILGKALFANGLISVGFFYFLPGLALTPKTILFLMLALALVLLFLWRRAFNDLIGAPFLRKKTLIIGWDAATVELAEALQARPQLGYQLTGFLRLPQHRNPVLPAPLMTKELAVPLSELFAYVHNSAIDRIIVSPEAYGEPGLTAVLHQCFLRGVKCVNVSTLFESTLKRLPLTLLNHLWFLEYGGEIRKRAYELTKRFTDLLVAVLMALVFFAPGLAIAFAVKWDSHGPVLYRQRRVGRGGREFFLIKFRSLIEHAERFGGLKINPDPRLTRVGALIRKTHLDELPQIINILKGEMSFVGPRPERPEYVEDLERKIPFYEMRSLVPSGITGWAQTNMRYDASVQDAPEKLQYDLYYIKHRSILFDVGIMIKTVRIILRGGGR